MDGYRAAADYKGRLKPIWCPGCGYYAFLSAFRAALARLELAPENVAVASGIGCGGRLLPSLNVYGFHCPHGRPLPVATGIKLGNPGLTVFAVSGDGDALAIGAGHLPHAAARNVGITLVLLDNGIYAMTKGQPSPTTPRGFRAKSAPDGKADRPLNPLSMMLAYRAAFVARGCATKPRQFTDLLIRAVQYPGFAFLHFISPCVTFHNLYPILRERQAPVPDSHDVTDRYAAMRLADDEERIFTGVFYEGGG